MPHGEKYLYEFGPFCIDTVERMLYRGETMIPLAPKPIETLMALLANRERVVLKDELMTVVWPDTSVEEGAVPKCVSAVREVLDSASDGQEYIMTVHRRGYRFVAPVRVQAGTRAEKISNQGVKKSDLLRDRILRWLARLDLKQLSIRLATFVLLAIALWVSLPSIARVFNNRGANLQQRGQLTPAIANYQRALTLNPGYAEAHYNLADAYEEISDYDKAIEEYRRAIQTEDTLYQAYNNLARIYILRGNYTAALGLLDHALNLKPQEPSVRYSLYKNHGWANLGLHLVGQAELDLKRALALKHDRGAAHCLMGQVLEARGEQSTAMREWESCAAYASGGRDVEPNWRSLAQERLRREGSK